MPKRISFPKHEWKRLRSLEDAQLKRYLDHLLKVEKQYADSLTNGHKAFAQRIFQSFSIRGIDVDPRILEERDRALGKFAPDCGRYIRIMAIQECRPYLLKLQSESPWTEVKE